MPIRIFTILILPVLDCSSIPGAIFACDAFELEFSPWDETFRTGDTCGIVAEKHFYTNLMLAS